MDAARRLGLAVTFGSDRCHVLDDPWRDGALPLRFQDPEASARQIVDYARSRRCDAIVSLGDRPTPTAARACRALGLPGHPSEAADACRDKYQSRRRLHAAGLNVPAFERFPLDADPRIAAAAVRFPCVLKPLALSASRGVIRANSAEEFVAAFERIGALLRSPDVQVMREATSQFIQVEDYIEGAEIAVEALVERGHLHVLAIFDKPDALAGPFFEETLYVTPSRLAPAVQAEVATALERAVRALGLVHGPVHAEFRLNGRDVWALEVAARSIGGLCSRALRFRAPSLSDELSLEELIIRLALGETIESVRRETAASGVMMVPIPQAGIFQGVQGLERALETPGVEDIRITARPTQRLVPLPEGSSYLGFIFARRGSPEGVERALRSAHGKLGFTISPHLRVIVGARGSGARDHRSEEMAERENG